MLLPLRLLYACLWDDNLHGMERITGNGMSGWDF
jgi:hypothetical protein